MSLAQYQVYQSEFGRKIPIRPTRKDVKGIGGKSKALGEVTIQVPFTNLNLILDIEFSILADDMPSLLCNRDLIENGLDISLQGAYLFVGDARETLLLDNYFLSIDGRQHPSRMSCIPNTSYARFINVSVIRPWRLPTTFPHAQKASDYSQTYDDNSRT